jgi:leucyl-tRNA---protein transferase
MESLYTFTTSPSSCSYLPDRHSRMRYEIVAHLSAAEYSERLLHGWRRFGHALFRPECSACRECRSLRVPVESFQPNRSQRRAWDDNAAELRLEIGTPAITRAKLDLYDRFHSHQTESIGWPEHGPKDPNDYIELFVDNPFITEEWCYYLGERLVGVGYVDRLPVGLSAIYFYYDPEERGRSLGTFNVLAVMRNARESKLPHLYLGYFVEGCRSLEYKSRFRPNEVLAVEGMWQAFRS